MFVFVLDLITCRPEIASEKLITVRHVDNSAMRVYYIHVPVCCSNIQMAKNPNIRNVLNFC